MRSRKSVLRKLARNRFFWSGAFVVVFFLISGYASLFSPLFHVKNIEVSGGYKVSSEDIQKFIGENIPRTIAFFKVNNVFLADTGEMKRDLEKRFPSLASVTVERKLFRSFIVHAQERREVAVWCQERGYKVEIENLNESKQRTTQQCFSLDENGVIFEQKQPKQELTIFANDFQKIGEIGERVVDTKILASLLKFQSEVNGFPVLKGSKVIVSSFIVFSNDNVHAKISDLSGREGWSAYLNPQETIDWQVTKLSLVLEQEISAAKRLKLEYIDLRFGDQAFIKYRN